MATTDHNYAISACNARIDRHRRDNIELQMDETKKVDPGGTEGSPPPLLCTSLDAGGTEGSPPPPSYGPRNLDIWPKLKLRQATLLPPPSGRSGSPVTKTSLPEPLAAVIAACQPKMPFEKNGLSQGHGIDPAEIDQITVPTEEMDLGEPRKAEIEEHDPLQPGSATPPPPGQSFKGREFSARGKTDFSVTRTERGLGRATAKPGGGPQPVRIVGTKCQVNLRQSTPAPEPQRKRRTASPDCSRLRKTPRDNCGSTPDMSTDDMSADDPVDTVREPRIPPIILDVPKNWASHAVAIGQLVHQDFEVTSSARRMRIKTSTVQHFRCIQRYLDDQKIPFHTFAMTGERLLKVVVRGLPPTLSPEEVRDTFLTTADLGVVEAKLLKTRRGQPTGLWLLTLRADPDKRPPSDVYSIDKIFYCKVEIRRYNRPTGPIQCHKCQGFGHGSSHCHRSVRCVKCGGEHPGSLCPKEPTAPARCCNCGESHTANYRGCKQYKHEKMLSYAAVAKISTSAIPTHPVTPEAKCTDEVGESPPPQTDDDGFQTQGRRRRRAQRNPANRGRLPLNVSSRTVSLQPSSGDRQPPSPDENTPALGQHDRPVDSSHGPRRTQRLRLELPDPRHAEQSDARTETATPTLTPSTTTEHRPRIRPDLASGITAILDQLRTVTTLMTQLVEALNSLHHG